MPFVQGCLPRLNEGARIVGFGCNSRSVDGGDTYDYDELQMAGNGNYNAEEIRRK